MDNSKKAKSSFAIQLIEELKKHECIAQGIMLPLLIGAYKVKEDYRGEDYLDFFKHIYSDVIESLYESEQHLHFRECESSQNFVFEPANKKPQKCNAVIIHKGAPVIYCSDPLLGNNSTMEANDMLVYFLNKLLAQTVKYCNFIDADPNTAEYKEWMCRLNDDEANISEKTIIESLIQQ